METSIKTIAIISIGEMGLGFAQLLIAHGYSVTTYAKDRSERTRNQASKAGVRLEESMEELVMRAEMLLSIVPPRDAYATAQRVVDAARTLGPARQKQLYYMDLNATSVETAHRTAELLGSVEHVSLIDGGIIGGVPYPLAQPSQRPDAGGNEATRSNGDSPAWHCPSVLVSGPTPLTDQNLVKILNLDHLSPEVGAATGVKMCFAALTKGFFGLAIQSYTTAHRLGVLENLRDYMSRYNQSTQTIAEKGLTVMPSKAYRWVGEMREIGDTFEQAGGFKSNLFYGVADVYTAVAEDSELGKELPGQRVRGKTVEDVVELLSEGMQAKKLKTA